MSIRSQGLLGKVERDRARLKICAANGCLSKVVIITTIYVVVGVSRIATSDIIGLWGPIRSRTN
jgi:hypothetical protein